MAKRLLLASPRGFCKGVERAIKILEQAIATENTIIYVFKEIVHNTMVVKHFESLGVVFVNEIDDIPFGSVVVLSAHGVAPSVRQKAKERELKVIDATCPLVTKVHNEAILYKEQGYTIFLIGHKNHDEVVGILGEAPDNIQVICHSSEIEKIKIENKSNISWLSQTTMNDEETQRLVNLLRLKYPTLQDPPSSDICYATKNRQLAVKNIAKDCDLFIIVGSENSSNANRLVEVALLSGAKQSMRIETPDDLDEIDFSLISTIGISSGASVPNEQLSSIINHLNNICEIHIEEINSATE